MPVWATSPENNLISCFLLIGIFPASVAANQNKKAVFAWPVNMHGLQGSLEMDVIPASPFLPLEAPVFIGIIRMCRISETTSCQQWRQHLSFLSCQEEKSLFLEFSSSCCSGRIYQSAAGSWLRLGAIRNRCIFKLTRIHFWGEQVVLHSGVGVLLLEPESGMSWFFVIRRSFQETLDGCVYASCWKVS